MNVIVTGGGQNFYWGAAPLVPSLNHPWLTVLKRRILITNDVNLGLELKLGPGLMFASFYV